MFATVVVVLLFVGCKSQDFVVPGDFPILGHLYCPAADAFFIAYHRGPCEVNEIILLPKSNVVPECASNPCRNDGFAQYEGECYELNTADPCRTGPVGKEELFNVNKTTFELQCVPKATNSKLLLSIIVFPSNCPPGSKRSVNKCKPEY